MREVFALSEQHRAKNFFVHLAYWHQSRRAFRVFARALSDGESVDPRPESPIIVIGMHRSGTSLLTRQLEDLGVNMGKWQDEVTREALFFRHRNQIMLMLASAAWDNPESFLRALEKPHWRQAFSRVAANDLETVRTANFLPPKRLAGFTSATNRMWGFKDPRTSITLPVWLDIFPNARIINIVRDGNAVASSLRERGKKQIHDGLPFSLVSQDLASGQSLWAEYVLTAHNHCSTLPRDNYLEIRYENLLQAPDAALVDIATFIGLDHDPELLEKAASRVNQVRRTIDPLGPVSKKAQRAFELYDYL